MIVGLTFGVAVQRAEGNDRNHASAVVAGHDRTATGAERLRKVPRTGQTPGPEVVFATREPQVRKIKKAIGRMGRGPRLATPRTVAVVHLRETRWHLEGDGVAQAAAVEDVRPRCGPRRHVDDRAMRAVIPEVMTRQIIGNGMPRRLESGEDVRLRPGAGIVIESAHRHVRITADGNHRPAPGTKGAIAPGRRFEEAGMALAGEEGHALRIDRGIGGKRRPMDLAAHHAVAMGHPGERTVDTPAHRAAQTAPRDHECLSPCSATSALDDPARIAGGAAVAIGQCRHSVGEGSKVRASCVVQTFMPKSLCASAAPNTPARHVEIRWPDKDPVDAVEAEDGMSISESAGSLHHGKAAHAGIPGRTEDLVAITAAEAPAASDTVLARRWKPATGCRCARMIKVLDVGDDDPARPSIERRLDRHARRLDNPREGLKTRFASQQDQAVDIAAIEDAVLHGAGDAMATVDPRGLDGSRMGTGTPQRAGDRLMMFFPMIPLEGSQP